tara:strand:+ start:972 stop:1247 length:276 start_codon:yes stop_codon:yes gene_type:complete
LVKPYIDKVLSDNVFIREFHAEVDGDELVWHRDKKNREFAVLEGQDWWFQEDDKMPVELEKGKIYTIEKDEYHRLLKGTEATNLKVKIWEE